MYNNPLSLRILPRLYPLHYTCQQEQEWLEREQQEAEARAKKFEEERLLRVCDTCNIDCGIVCSWSLTLRHSLLVGMISDLSSMASFPGHSLQLNLCKQVGTSSLLSLHTHTTHTHTTHTHTHTPHTHNTHTHTHTHNTHTHNTQTHTTHTCTHTHTHTHNTQTHTHTHTTHITHRRNSSRKRRKKQEGRNKRPSYLLLWVPRGCPHLEFRYFPTMYANIITICYTSQPHNQPMRCQ